MHTNLNKMKLKLGYILTVLILIFLWTELLIGESFMYWDSNFTLLALPNIASREQISEGGSSANLSINADVEISADNSTAAQLFSATDTLFTEYKLTFDGDGSSTTGGAGTNYETYDSFLTTAAPVTYVLGDDDVQVTVHVKVSNYANDLSDAGEYTATQTLTVYWVGP
jgi:cytoskeletal protein RodZ